MDDPPFADKVIRDFVVPFYLTVNMRLPVDRETAAEIGRAARRATLDEVLWMLGTHWRPRRVGAWFALARPEHEVGGALLTSLRTSLGFLTAPDLGYSAVRRLGADALDALHEYQASAFANNYGGLSEISALIELAGGKSEVAGFNEIDSDALKNRADWASVIEST